MHVSALDIGGANIKYAGGDGTTETRAFALWKKPEALEETLRSILRTKPPSETLAITMTGELCDCYPSKAEGVRAIVKAAVNAMKVWRRTPTIRVWTVDATLETPDSVLASPELAAAANWLALAEFAAQIADSRPGILIDVGSTTTDLVPFGGGKATPRGKTDPERLLARELVYSGVERTPIAMTVRALPYRGRDCPVAREVFATTIDAYLVLGLTREQAVSSSTADGHAATKAAARVRLARMVCADETTFSADDAMRAANVIYGAQRAEIARALEVVQAGSAKPAQIAVTAGSGEFLARRIAEEAGLRVISIGERYGEPAAEAACAFALAMLAGDAVSERRPAQRS